MFGNAPKAMWERWIPPDDSNRIPLACRCLLVRDGAAFIPGLTDLLQATGRLEIVTGDRATALGDGYRFHRSAGHTPGLLLTEVDAPAGPIVFAADLIPGKAWVHLPITMGYDR